MYWGTYQKLIYGTLELELRLSDFVFTPGLGNTNLERIGYDRYADPDLLPSPFYSYVGASHIEAPAYTAPQKFAWELQYLSPDSYDLLIAIVRRSHQDKAPIRLQDSLLIYDEVAPRTRAKVGSFEQTKHGVSFYFAQFNIWLKDPIKKMRLNGKHYLSLEGVEWNPKEPVDLLEDAA